MGNNASSFEKVCSKVIIKNCITIICFTVLAIYFNKWWIILFSGLFHTEIKGGYQSRDDSEESNKDARND